MIVNIKVTDPVVYGQYKQLAEKTVSMYGGKYPVGGGTTHVLEGSFIPDGFVMLEFKNIDQAKKWWSSEEYREPKKLRALSAATSMVVAEGF